MIGGGVIGLHCAYFLRQSGFAVTVVSADAVGASQCSTGNAGMIVPSHFTPLAAPGMVRYGLSMMLRRGSPFGLAFPPSWEQLMWMARFVGRCRPDHVARSGPILRDLGLASRAEYDSLFRTLGVSEALHLRGLDVVCRDASTWHHERAVADRAKALGLETEVLAEDAIDPVYRKGLAGVLRYRQDGWFEPGPWLARLREHLEAEGVNFVYGAAVEGARTEGDRVVAVETQVGSLEGDEFVLAAGVWSSDLGRALGLRLPMVAGKGVSLDLRTETRPAVCALLIEGRVAISPFADTVRIAGTMQIGPPSRPVAASRLEGLRQVVQHYIPAYTPAALRPLPVWTGSRPCSPDGLPYLGRTRHRSNLIVATGHAMMGLSLAAATGRLVREVAEGVCPCVALDALHPDRYGN